MTRTPRRASSYRKLVRASALLTATAATLALTLGPGAGVALARKGQTTRLHKGLTLTRFTVPGPNRVRVLTISNPRKYGVSLAVGSATQSWPGMRKPSDIAHSYHALATVNGDFSLSGRPVHVSAADGVLRSDGLATGVGFSVSGNDIRAYAKRPAMKVIARTDNKNVPKFEVDKWNSDFGGHKLAAYTTVGGHVAKPPSNVCSAKLDPAGKLEWSPTQAGVTRTYVVSRQMEPCPKAAPTIADPGSVLVAASKGTPKGNQIKALDQNDTVKLTWSAGWKGALDLIGGNPQLLTDPGNHGHPRNVAPAHCGGSYFCNRNPRTGVGINRDCALGRPGCKIFLVTVDGRRSGWSVGMTLPAFANVFKSLGATYAINLDGGGGTTMWTARHGKYCMQSAAGGCLVNRPSDGAGERKSSEALMVVAGKEAQPPTAPVRALDAGSPGDVLLPLTMPDPAADQAELTDPGSTGGLFDAIESGGLGGGRVPLEVQRGARIFRAAHARG
jgi:Phosphodiester glycosidase